MSVLLLLALGPGETADLAPLGRRLRHPGTCHWGIGRSGAARPSGHTDLNSRCPETLARCKDVRRELEGWDAVTRGWERNVPYLLRLDDPRARRRLDRIIGSPAVRWTELRWDEHLDK